MRIITGTLKGRTIPFNNKKYGNARTTSGRVKEAVFSMLGNDLADFRFLDLFACSGQIGLEALSRGAHATLNESNPRRHRFLADLLPAWHLENIQLYSRPALKLVTELAADCQTFDIVYLDPPYHETVADESIALATLKKVADASLVASRGLVLVQHAPTIQLPPVYSSHTKIRTKEYGDTHLTVYRNEEAPNVHAGLDKPPQNR
ncbi:MAG: RsmD family RNA methyltransferase [bacterium]|nr:RsmD family RNA methyltransferase [bacterium]